MSIEDNGISEEYLNVIRKQIEEAISDRKIISQEVKIASDMVTNLTSELAEIRNKHGIVTNGVNLSFTGIYNTEIEPPVFFDDLDQHVIYLRNDAMLCRDLHQAEKSREELTLKFNEVTSQVKMLVGEYIRVRMALWNQLRDI
ncbi:gp34 [Listeria phage P40]|uniref:gp34 n=1 Tax=Listeria phage P40 TaxID=560178 RepID=UPI00018198E8|nr:gp34 [Listeria phage P40]ACI00394.1 gp34 [Listeria phage P40]